MFKIKISRNHAGILADALKKEFGVDFIAAEIRGCVAIGETKKLHRDRKRHVVTFVKAFILGVQVVENHKTGIDPHRQP